MGVRVFNCISASFITSLLRVHARRFVGVCALALISGACDQGGEPKVLQGRTAPTCKGVVAIDCAAATGVCEGAEPRCDEIVGWVCQPVAANTNANAYEIVETRCDGRDNDCDGDTDEDLGSVSCGEGACAHLAARCSGGVEAVCDPLTGASDETCDGVDNDCDGDTDEDLVSPPSQLQAGVCAGSIAVCQGRAGWVEPDYREGLGYEQLEVSCDSRDNDCDGATDEELGSITCGEGVCAHTADICQGGEFVLCDAWLGASEEVCDGLDNDCDGASDEDLVGPPASLTQGVCASLTRVCDGTSWVEPPLETIVGYEANETTCDGRDNDCDGETDENGGTVTCGTGICAHSEGACIGGELVGCDAFRGAVTEVCDGLDNDCDGLTDEALVAPKGDRINGVCSAATRVCRGAAGWVEPGYGTLPGYEANESTCDGRDNDCDGRVDEDLGTTTCGSGQCSHTVAVCAGGVPAVCDPLAGAVAEQCDGVDNDCDGVADEDLVPPAADRGAGVCSPMAKVCRGRNGWGEPDYLNVHGFQVQESTCDGLDNDCDGFTDEALGTTTCGIGICLHTSLNCSGGAPNVCNPLQGQRAETCNGLDDDCDGATDDGATCGGNDLCQAGRCVPNTSTCGNGTIEAGEQCDDGNVSAADDCDASCQIKGICDDSCGQARDGVCQDGGLAAVSTACAYGTDCADCSPRRDEPCHELPVEGACIGRASIGSCVTTGASAPRAVVAACDPGEVCAVRGATLEATCVAEDVPECTPGDSKCVDDARLECNASGHWQRTDCAEACMPFVLGSFCDQNVGSRLLSGTVAYQARTANDTLSDWGAPFDAPLIAAQIVSYVWDASSDSYAVYDSVETGPDGSYDLRVKSTPGTKDTVIVWMMRLADDGEVALAVANPSFGAAGRRPVFDVLNQAAASSIWSFSVPAASLLNDPAIKLTEASYSAVARVFEHMRYVYDTTRAVFGTPGDPLVLWMEPDVTWDRGACTTRYPMAVGEHPFASAIWIAYSSDQGYWSDAVVVHELGHWVMGSYGTSPREGGVHYVGQPTLPGQAWSEGFATFFSSLARGNEIYFDKQGGNFFWFDLREMTYPSRGMILPTADGVGYPYANDPLLQLIDENVVAAMTYSMAINSQPAGTAAPPRLESEGPFLMQALASDRMNVKRLNPSATFQRRYVRHTWRLDANHQITDITPIWTTSSPMFADYLDALRCLGLATGRDVDPLVAESILTYPYPIGSSPICQ